MTIEPSTPADTITDGDPEVQPHASRSLDVSTAVARLHKQFIGRGPSNTRTTIDGDLVVCLLEGGYTRAEETLAASSQADLVTAHRAGLQDAMRDALVEAIESIVGRRVRSLMSAQDLERNLQVEVFVLASEDSPPPYA